MLSIDKIKEIREYCKEEDIETSEFVSTMMNIESKLFCRDYSKGEKFLTEDYYERAFEITKRYFQRYGGRKWTIVLIMSIILLEVLF